MDSKTHYHKTWCWQDMMSTAATSLDLLPLGAVEAELLSKEPKRQDFRKE
jgi:hypothetical protein